MTVARKLSVSILLSTLFVMTFVVESHAEQVAVNTSSPRATTQTLYYLMSPDVNDPDKAAELLNASWLKHAEKVQRVEHLKTILDGKGLQADYSKIPKDSNYVDSESNTPVYKLFTSEPRIVLEKVGSAWLISGATVGSIPQMYAEVLPFGLDAVVSLIPAQGTRILGFYVWQLVGLALLLVVGFILGKLSSVVAVSLLKRVAKKWEMPAESIDVLKSLSKPLGIFVGIMIFGFLQPVLRLPVEFSRFTVLAVKFALPVFAIAAAYRFVDFLAIRAAQLAERTVSTLDDQLIPLLRKALKFFVIIIGLLFLLQHLDYDITAVLAGVSIGGIAFAFAAQDTIRNLFGSIMLFTDRPFTVGDWVTFQGGEGYIEEVGFRSTRIRTMADTVISVPNGRLADMTVDNFGLRIVRRYRTTLGVVYSTPPDLMQQFLEKLRTIISEHPATAETDERTLVNFREFGSSSLNIEIQLYLACPNMAEEWQAREELNMAFLETANKLGISYAFPSQSVYLESVPASLQLPSSTKS